MNTLNQNKETLMSDKFNICFKVENCNILNENELELMFCLPCGNEWSTYKIPVKINLNNKLNTITLTLNKTDILPYVKKYEELAVLLYAKWAFLLSGNDTVDATIISVDEKPILSLLPKHTDKNGLDMWGDKNINIDKKDIIQF